MVVTSWRMTRYMRGVPVPGFASFLGSVGLVSSLKIILDAVNLLVLEPESEDRPKTIFSLFAIPWMFSPSAIYVAGIFEMLLNIGMLVFFFKLWKTVSDTDMVGMRSLVKIGCYLMAGLELLVCTIIIGIIVYLLKPQHGGMVEILYIITTISSGVFACLLIGGVRKVRPGCVNANIIFKITFFILYLFFAFIITGFIITLNTKHIGLGAKYKMYVVNLFVYTSWLILYSSSFTVLQYNIMLQDQQGYDKLEMEERQNQL